MNLKSCLESFDGPIIIPPPPLAREPRMLKAREHVERKLEALYANPPGLDIEELHSRLNAAVVSNIWDNIADREWRYVPLCLTIGSPSLLENQKFMNFYLARLSQDPSRLALRHLIRIYLQEFNPEVFGISAIAVFLAGRTDLEAEWAQRHREIDLFSVGKAPVRLAEMALSADSPVGFLSNVGFELSYESARLAGHAFINALLWLEQTLRRAPSTGPILKVMKWAMKEDRQFRYPSVPRIGTKLAETLLLPWEAHDPPEDVKYLIERFMLDNYGDLRVNRSKWIGVREEAQAVMRRWLTKMSLDWFLTVVDETTTKPEVKHMWPARRKFWNAYQRRGYMQEAWVIFGRVGTDHATKVARRKPEDRALTRSFGRLQGGGIATEHAVLLMRVGDLTIADWNFNGKCHIWLAGNSKAPKLYRQEYDRFELTNNSNFQQVHHTGAWQSSIYDFILKYTGASMPRPDYM